MLPSGCQGASPHIEIAGLTSPGRGKSQLSSKLAHASRQVQTRLIPRHPAARPSGERTSSRALIITNQTFAGPAICWAFNQDIL